MFLIGDFLQHAGLFIIRCERFLHDQIETGFQSSFSVTVMKLIVDAKIYRIDLIVFKHLFIIGIDILKTMLFLQLFQYRQITWKSADRYKFDIKFMNELQQCMNDKTGSDNPQFHSIHQSLRLYIFFRVRGFCQSRQNRCIRSCLRPVHHCLLQKWRNCLRW